MNTSEAVLLHPETKKQADFFLKKPVSPLLILGPRGAGKSKLAYRLSAFLLGLNSKDQLFQFAYFFHAKKPAGKQEISIDTVREITSFVKLKAPGKSEIRRVVLIEDAQHLSREAQNALLKALEEPGKDTLFMLTAPHEHSLLPTMVSRCHPIRVHPVTLEQAEIYYADNIDPKKLKPAWLLSRGNAELLGALLDEDLHPLKQSIEQAKLFIMQPNYDRLLSLESIMKNKEETTNLLEALAKILAALHRRALDSAQASLAKRLLHDRKLVNKSIESIGLNGNLRLICLNLVLNLKN